jgi:hypothetical protein
MSSTKLLFKKAKEIVMQRKIAIILCIVLFQFSSFGAQYEKLISDFRTPAANNHLFCYWYWINDDISMEGISKDLAAMKEAGIGTAFIGNINPPQQDGKVPLFSDLWWECMVHAVNEGKRLGVDIGVFNCPGWSQSGGPWVKPEMAMRYLTYSETVIQGPVKISQKLVKPKEEFQDVYVLAYPAFDELKTLTRDNATIQVIPEVKDAQNWIDGDLATTALFSSAGAKQYSIEFHAKIPMTARSIVIRPVSKSTKSHGPSMIIQCKLYARIDSVDKLLRSFQFDRGNQNVQVGPITNGLVAVSLPQTTAQVFKLVCSGVRGTNYGFTQIEITEKAVLDRYIEKQLGKMHPTPLPMWGSYLWDQQKSVARDLKVPTENVIDISDKMDIDGNLNWQVPGGKWIVMRIGMTPTGTENHPAAPQGKGYEIDKANEEMIRFHFEQYVGKLRKKIPAKNRDALKYVIMDSYEMGSQNWTDGFEQRFEERYGYNPKKWLPVLSGVIVSSVTESNRFLWDLRRAVADDVAYEYVGGLRKISNQYGLQTWLENYGHWGFPSEFLMYGGQSNLVGGEFWNEGTLGNIECKAASSCVHTYGKKICFAEAFTSKGQAYMRHPEKLKRRGDWSFTEGINQFVLHLYIQQPDDGRIPGMNAWFGTEFNRHNTWFDQSTHWMDYNRRCQHLLQQGAYVADVCYFISENAPKMTGVRSPEIPDGYSYDYINAEVIVNDLKVKDGKLVLPSGASYSLMVLPPLDTMRPAVVAKLEKLVKQGGVIYGPKPVRSPSLQDYPKCDKKVRAIADKVWGRDYLGGKLSTEYGSGRVFDGVDLNEVLNELKVTKDFALKHDSVLWTHRTMPGADIYFLSNQSGEKIDFTPTFRVTGLKPQIWDAVTGDVRLLHDYNQSQQSISVPMMLEPGQSQFIVFTNDSTGDVHAGYTDNFPLRQELLEVGGSWTVVFDNPVINVREKQTFNTLSDWSVSDNDAVKYYSGTAEYSTEFTLDSISASKDIFINLGKVGVMAEVAVNGKFAGGTWMHPYVLNVTDLVKPGRNTLKIEVVNLWRNYLVKEKSLPSDQQKTWMVVSDVEKNEPLQPSGLLGPVKLETIDRK